MAALDRECPQAYKDAVWKRLQLLRDSLELRGYNGTLGNQPKYIIDRVMQLHPTAPKYWFPAGGVTELHGGKTK